MWIGMLILSWSLLYVIAAESADEQISKVLPLLFYIAIFAIIISLVSFVFWLILLIDCINREFKTKIKWLLLIILVPFGWIFYYFKDCR